MVAARAALSRLDEWRILADAASDLASDGLLRTAAFLAAEIGDAEEQSKARAAIALHTAARGYVAAARAITTSIRVQHWREMVMERLASISQEAGGPGDGIAVADGPPDRFVVEPSGIDWGEIRDLTRALREHCEGSPELKAMSEAAELRSREKLSHAGKAFWTARIGDGPTCLEILARQPRDLVATELRKLAPLLAISFAEKDAEEVIAAVCDVSRWWP